MKILEIDTCENCFHRAKFSNHCLHHDTFNIVLNNDFSIPDYCPLKDDDWIVKELENELKQVERNILEPVAYSEDFWSGVKNGLNVAIIKYALSIKSSEVLGEL